MCSYYHFDESDILKFCFENKTATDRSDAYSSISCTLKLNYDDLQARKQKIFMALYASRNALSKNLF